jgi:hypothetical protein
MTRTQAIAISRTAITNHGSGQYSVTENHGTTVGQIPPNTPAQKFIRDRRAIHALMLLGIDMHDARDYVSEYGPGRLEDIVMGYFSGITGRLGHTSGQTTHTKQPIGKEAHR